MSRRPPAVLLAGALALACALAASDAAAQVPSDPRAFGAAAVDLGPAAVRAAIDRGVAWVLGDQNVDGSWGGPRNKTMTDGFANVETHHAWSVATTGLVVMALLEAAADAEKARAAVARGCDYLQANAKLGRPDSWDNDNVWGQIYGLHGVVRALAAPGFADATRAAGLRAAADEFCRGLARFQSPRGGWGYYADPQAAWRPEWATTFTTAAAVIALTEAERAGIAVPQAMLAAAVGAVARGRLPSGAYTYDVAAIPAKRGVESINDVRGSLGRIQACEFARHFAGEEIPLERRIRDVEVFFEQHRFLDCAFRRPIPHEAWYANAAYFYLFGHYHAALLLSTLPAEHRARFVLPLRATVLKAQDQDGGFWDFYISSHTKPYGTAFAIMALLRTLPPASAGSAAPDVR